MPKPRIQIEIVAKVSQAQLDTARAAIETELVKRAISDRLRNWALLVDDETGQPRYVCHLRYTTRAGGDFIWGRLQNAVSAISANVRGKVSYHQCPHGDVVIYDCKTDVRAEFVEVKF